MPKNLYITLFLLILVSFKANAQTFVKGFKEANSFKVLNDVIYFAGNSSDKGLELWKSDGTVEGTQLLKDIMPGTEGSGISNITIYNNKIYFAASDLMNGREVWVSDGTEAGTKMLKDINPNRLGTNNAGSDPRAFTICNGILYFIINGSSGYGNALWKTDGTELGTQQVFGGDFYTFTDLNTVGNKLYFYATSHRKLYVSDGTTAGTEQLAIDDYEYLVQFKVINEKLVFATLYGHSSKFRLYQLDPTNNSVSMLKSYEANLYGGVEINNITGVGNIIYFSTQIDDGNSMRVNELWKTDGTAAGTIMVKSFAWNPHISNSNIKNFLSFNDKLYFTSGTSDHLWTSDGTPNGTAQLGNYTLNGSFLVSGSKLYFNGTNNQLYSLEGAAAKPEFPAPTRPEQLFEFRKNVYFTSGQFPAVVGLWNIKPAPLYTVSTNMGRVTNSGTITFSTTSETAYTYDVTLTNTGNKELSFSEISVNEGPFYVSGQVKQVLLPGEKTSFKLIYYPSKEEAIRSNLIIKSNDSENGLFLANLAGIALRKIQNPVAYSGDSLLKTIKFEDPNPDFKLSNTYINENIVIGTVIGEFGDNNTYTLIEGSGGADNGAFKIENGKLISLLKFNYALKQVYSVRIKATNINGMVSEKVFALSVQNVQEPLTPAPCVETGEILTYTLIDVAYTKSRIIAVGKEGKLLISDDDGKQWKTSTINSPYVIREIKMFDQIGYINTWNGTLFKTVNGGDSWHSVNVPDVSYPYLHKMYFYSSTVGFLMGENKLFKTTDGGKSWKKISAFYENPSSMWFINDNEGFSCGRDKSLYRTRDGGDTWERINLSIAIGSTLSAITFTNEKIGYLVDNLGNLAKTNDGGSSWVILSTQVYGEKITFTDENVGFIYGQYENIFKTTDGGITWTKENFGDGLISLKGFAVNPAKNKFCAVGSYWEKGHSIFLKDGNLPWVKRSEIRYENFFANVNFLDEKVGYAFGRANYGAGNFKTIDGGITWKEMNIGSDGLQTTVSSSFFINKDIGFCNYYLHLMKTTDGGETWKRVPISLQTSISNIYFMTPQIGILVSGNSVFKTIDGGESWKNVFTTDIFTTGIQFLNTRIGFISGIAGIIKTKDSGETWQLVSSPKIETILSSHFFDEQHGLLGGTAGQLYRTKDGGNTWVEVRTQVKQDIYSFSFYDSSHGYLISTNNVSNIYETFDSGETWTAKNLGQGGGVRYLNLVNNNQGFAGSSGNVILKLKSDRRVPVIDQINGDLTVAAGTRQTYTIPNLLPETYKWMVTGDPKITYKGNSIEITWTQSGTYTVQATPSNSCDTGKPFEIIVDVKNVPEIQISGPQNVLTYTNNVEYVALNQNGTYVWSVKGATSFTTDGNKLNVNWGPEGVGVVTLIQTFQDLNIKKATSLSVNISAFPITNFTVSSKDVTCKDSNTGSISVKTLVPLNYVANITGPNNFTSVSPFISQLEWSNLLPGKYTVCITLANNSSFQKCFTVNVNEPKNLSLYSSIDEDKKILNLNLSGAKVYYIELNDKKYQTTDTIFTVKLSAGINKLKLFSDKVCQGVIEKVVRLNDISVYPNPVLDWLTIDLSGKQTKTVGIKITDFNGRLLYTKEELNVQSARVNLSHLNRGIYLLQLSFDGRNTVKKIIKK